MTLDTNWAELRAVNNAWLANAALSQGHSLVEGQTSIETSENSRPQVLPKLAKLKAFPSVKAAQPAAHCQYL